MSKSLLQPLLLLALGLLGCEEDFLAEVPSEGQERTTRQTSWQIFDFDDLFTGEDPVSIVQEAVTPHFDRNGFSLRLQQLIKREDSKKFGKDSKIKRSFTQAHSATFELGMIGLQEKSIYQSQLPNDFLFGGRFANGDSFFWSSKEMPVFLTLENKLTNPFTAFSSEGSRVRALTQKEWQSLLSKDKRALGKRAYVGEASKNLFSFPVMVRQKTVNSKSNSETYLPYTYITFTNGEVLYRIPGHHAHFDIAIFSTQRFQSTDALVFVFIPSDLSFLVMAREALGTSLFAPKRRFRLSDPDIAGNRWHSGESKELYDVPVRMFDVEREKIIIASNQTAKDMSDKQGALTFLSDIELELPEENLRLESLQLNLKDLFFDEATIQRRLQNSSARDPYLPVELFEFYSPKDRGEKSVAIGLLDYEENSLKTIQNETGEEGVFSEVDFFRYGGGVWFHLTTTGISGERDYFGLRSYAPGFERLNFSQTLMRPSAVSLAGSQGPYQTSSAEASSLFVYPPQNGSEPLVLEFSAGSETDVRAKIGFFPEDTQFPIHSVLKYDGSFSQLIAIRHGDNELSLTKNSSFDGRRRNWQTLTLPEEMKGKILSIYFYEGSNASLPAYLTIVTTKGIYGTQTPLIL